MTRVVIADDEELVRAGIRLIIESGSDIEVVAEAAEGRQAVEACRAHRPDVVLMDARMPGTDGLSALEELSRGSDAPRVIMLTAFDTDSHLHRALRAGAAGFLLKDTPPTDLVAAVRTAAGGGAVLAPSATNRLIAAYAGPDPQRPRAAARRLAVLTDRERAVADALSCGLANAEIARALQMSEATVKAHVSKSLTKLDMTNRVQLAILAHEAHS